MLCKGKIQSFKIALKCFIFDVFSLVLAFFSRTRGLCWCCFLFFFRAIRCFFFFLFTVRNWCEKGTLFVIGELKSREQRYRIDCLYHRNWIHVIELQYIEKTSTRGSSSTLDGACAKDDAAVYFTMIKFCNMLTVVLLWLWSVVKKTHTVLEFTGFSNTDFCLQQLLDCFINWLFRIL